MLSKVDEIKTQLKQARNSSYLSKYEDSLKIYKKIIDSIEQQIMLNNIPVKQIEQYRTFESNVIAEKNIVQNLLGMLSGLDGPHMKSHRLADSPPILQHHFSEGPQPYRQNPFMYKQYSTNAQQKSNEEQLKNLLLGKDPDVWDPPPPLHDRKKPTIKRNISINPTQQSHSNSKTLKKQLKKGQNAKNNFLLARYPDGSGPDTNLIEMLERQIMDQVPSTTFDDIADLQTAKGLLQEAVLLPLKMPQFFTGIRRAWRGVLMFGPPGTGKTLLAKAVAASGGTKFFNVSASSLASKWKGESQKLVRILFQMAKFYAPSVIFFDEIDSIGGRRKDGEDQSNRKVKTELLVQMDGTNSSENEQNKFVIVLAATNRPWDLDEALRRRLEKRIYIPLPTEKGRQQLVKINLKNVKIDEQVDLGTIVKKTDGYSGADITNLCRQAAYMPMRRKLKSQGGYKNISNMKQFEEDVNVPLKKQDFLDALKNVNKSVGKEDLGKYEKWMKQFGSV